MKSNFNIILIQNEILEALTKSKIRKHVKHERNFKNSFDISLTNKLFKQEDHLDAYSLSCIDVIVCRCYHL